MTLGARKGMGWFSSLISAITELFTQEYPTIANVDRLVRSNADRLVRSSADS